MQIIHIIRDRYRLWLLVFLTFLGISFITRLVLLLDVINEVAASIIDLVLTFLSGFFYDVLAGLYFSIPALLVNGCCSSRFLRSKTGRVFMKAFYWLHVVVLVFNALSEYFFWKEFSVRYNFIAVDYLVYTNEVWKNIEQSYPIYWLIALVLVVSILIVWWLGKYLVNKDLKTPAYLRFGWMAFLLLLAFGAFLVVSDSWKNQTANKLNNELAGNGWYQFGVAFRKNAMPYLDFYSTNSNEAVFQRLRKELQQPNAEFVDTLLTNLRRRILPDSLTVKRNVVLITVESLSAEYLDYFADYHQRSYPQFLAELLPSKPKITPVLDSLIHESLFFTQLYASGTRTVRGLEALSTGLPPTPGQSIVKRLPTNENLFTMGAVLKKQGYDCKFIYGGNSFFDNMGDFYSKNGYTVIDESDYEADSIHHETAWGICDEDLYAMALKEMDKSYSNGQIFFHQLMTVSHHRPYTYPEGRVVIPPAIKRREGALQYTDYAIGDFLAKARQKPWFSNTLFVIVADHCASSAGHTNMPLNRYHIPCWIYAPDIIQPAKFERFTSQIDLPPTILGLLNIPYESAFFGYDMFKLEPGRERLLMVNYQDIGFYKNGKLVVLSPKQEVHSYIPDFRNGDLRPVANDTALVNDAISYFQGAAYLVDQHQYQDK